MNIRPKALVQSAAIILSIMLFPGTALVQEQKDPPVTPQETVTAEPVPQQPGEVITPKEEIPTEPEREQQGGLVVPTPPAESAKTEEPEEPAVAPAKLESTQYTIKKGDTLWDISNAFFRDPFLWPFIWQANPFITNPDLIYPDNKLNIPNLAPIERALKAPAPKKQLVEKPVQTEEVSPKEGISGATMKPKPAPIVEEAPTAGSSLILPEEQAVPIIDKYAMLSAGYVDSVEMNGRIVGSPEEEKTSFGYGDTVYVKIPSAQNVNIGDKFLISLPGNTVKHPKTGKSFGRLIKGLGILQITAKDSPNALTARITLSFDTIEKDNMLAPYQEPALVYNSSQKKTKDISGYILEVTDNRAINAQLHFVYLDKGSTDGVEPGDRLIVYRAPEDGSFPNKKIGEVQVFIVKPNSSTAVVRRSTDTMAKGDIVDFKK
jgi:LysM repeat protein